MLFLPHRIGSKVGGGAAAAADAEFGSWLRVPTEERRLA